VGQGPLEVSGNPQITDPNNSAGVRQRARSLSGGPVNVVVGRPEVRFEDADGHSHFHLMRAIRYSLWNLERTAQVAPNQKVGFCLVDSLEAPASPVTPDPRLYTFGCQTGNPDSTSLKMGVSSGWRDRYPNDLAYQWIDVSNTAPGQYVIASDADPDNTLWEGGGAAESNARAFATGPTDIVTVPGWTAQPVSLAQTGAAQAVPLSSQRFGNPSNLRYRIESAPAHGTLNVPIDQDFVPGTQLVYTPTPGFLGGDSFTYVARSSSSYPITPPAATVAIADRSPAVAISGAPASMVAGTSVQLSAALSNLPGGVSWSASAGAAWPTGVFTAPATPPAGGTATVRATSTANPAVAGQVVIAITPKPRQTAKPDPFGSLTAGRKLLSPLRIRRVSSRVIVAKVVTGGKGGRIVITTTFGLRVVGRCASRIGARQGFTCKVKLKRNYPLKKVRVTAKFVARGGGTAVRRAWVVR
jgi:hypothetical protein